MASAGQGQVASPHPSPPFPPDLSRLPGREPPGGRTRHRRAPEGPQPCVQSSRRTPSHRRRITGARLRWLRSGPTSPAPVPRRPLWPASSLRRQPAAAVPRQWSGSSGVGGNAGTWAVPFAPPGPSALRIPKPRAGGPEPRVLRIGIKQRPWRLSRLMSSARKHKVRSGIPRGSR